MKKNSRKLSRQLLQLLPDRPRSALVRNLAHLNPSWPSDSLEIKIATTEDELAAAYHLLHESYVQSGFMNPDPSEMRVLPQHVLPQTTTIVAKWDGQVIGTLSLIRDNPFGLPVEKIFNISERRQGGRRLAEVSSLAIDPKYRGQANQALFPLFRFVYQYAKHYFGTHEFIIAVNPATVDMYLSFMLFERLSSRSKSYDFVQGAPAVGLFLNFDTCEDRWEKVFASKPTHKNFHKYWTEIPTDARNALPVRKYHTSADIIMTPQLLKNFYLRKAGLEKKLTFENILELMNAYPFPAFQEILKPLHEVYFRETPRMETQMRGVILLSLAHCEVWNVSKEGLLVRAPKDSLLKGQQIKLKVWLNNETETTLEVQVCWSEQSCLYGLKIISGSQIWDEMIELVENEYTNHVLRLAS